MGLVETEGLVLKSYSLAEADKIVVLLTQNEGLVRGVAKGAKRLKSRFGGGLEPFSVVQVTYFQKEERELVSISHIELVKSYFEKASEPEFFEKFAYLVELLVEFAPPHDPNESLYRMAKVCLETASENPQNLDGTVVYFELWILRLNGYLPDWNKCDNCKKEFGADEEASLQINFHLQCENCQKSRNGWRIRAADRQIFKNAQKLSPGKFVEFSKNKEKNLKEVSSILKRIISNILGRDINAEKKSVAGIL
ncbi:MAG: DNA repair protein RecO [Pyrinomonadaceae bacterium]